MYGLQSRASQTDSTYSDTPGRSPSGRNPSREEHKYSSNSLPISQIASKGDSRLSMPVNVHQLKLCDPEMPFALFSDWLEAIPTDTFFGSSN